MGPAQLKNCIGESLKFTITSAINGEIDIGLSNDYCSRLLQDDPSNPFPSSTGIQSQNISKGVPSYPLYKHLAVSLFQCISSGAPVRTCDKVSSVFEDSSLKKKEDEWITLIVEKGTELLNMLEIVDFELHVQEPFFSQLKDGQKTVEGRCAYGSYKRIVPGSLILVNKCLLLQVQDVRQYVSFLEMLEAESLQRVLPGITTIDEGVQVYRNFYSEEKESSNGVLAICVMKPTSPLHDVMATILLSWMEEIGRNEEITVGKSEASYLEEEKPRSDLSDTITFAKQS